jgi:hypothetical protein
MIQTAAIQKVGMAVIINPIRWCLMARLLWKESRVRGCLDVSTPNMKRGTVIAA